jgi:hypothetical protein
MVNNTTVPVECEGHEFSVAIHDNYFDLFFGEATDSRATVGYRGPFKKREDLPQNVKQAMDQHPNGNTWERNNAEYDVTPLCKKWKKHHGPTTEPIEACLLN